MYVQLEGRLVGRVSSQREPGEFLVEANSPSNKLIDVVPTDAQKELNVH